MSRSNAAFREPQPAMSMQSELLGTESSKFLPRMLSDVRVQSSDFYATFFSSSGLFGQFATLTSNDSEAFEGGRITSGLHNMELYTKENTALSNTNPGLMSASGGFSPFNNLTQMVVMYAGAIAVCYGALIYISPNRSGIFNAVRKKTLFTSARASPYGSTKK